MKVVQIMALVTFLTGIACLLMLNDAITDRILQ